MHYLKADTVDALMRAVFTELGKGPFDNFPTKSVQQVDQSTENDDTEAPTFSEETSAPTFEKETFGPTVQKETTVGVKLLQIGILIGNYL